MTIEQIEKKYKNFFTNCIGFEVGPGWLPLIEVFCELCTQKQWDVTIWQLKEKFSTLALYADCPEEEFQSVVRTLELLSAKICEDCSRPSEVVTKGWMKTYCRECAEKSGMEYTIKQDI